MHNHPIIFETLEGTEQSWINKFNIVNNFCVVTIILQSRHDGL